MNVNIVGIFTVALRDEPFPLGVELAFVHHVLGSSCHDCSSWFLLPLMPPCCLYIATVLINLTLYSEGKTVRK